MYVIDIEEQHNDDVISHKNVGGCTVNTLNCEQCCLQYCDFFNNYLIENIPCLIKNLGSSWECSKKWIKGNAINHDYISDKYGDLVAPIANCNKLSYNSHCKEDMKVKEYMNYLKNNKRDQHLYLKDWHLRKSRPNDLFYEVPSIFASDWLNEFAQDHQEDDFMFVYIGPEKSWTPLHVDVYCSYSWSVNVVGRKRWILFPPGEENKMKDSHGNLPLIFKSELYPDIKYMDVVQEKGDGIFVPSGWYHQVVNEVDTISINHNWINACNIKSVWTALQNSLLEVEQEIIEFKDTPEYTSQCQLILKSLFGMDFCSFVTFLCYIANKRLSQLQGASLLTFDRYTLGPNQINFDLHSILNILDSVCAHPIYTQFEKLNELHNKLMNTMTSLKNTLK